MVEIILEGVNLTTKIKDWRIVEKKGEFFLTVVYNSGKEFSKSLSEWSVFPINELRGDLLFDKKKRTVQRIDSAVEYGEKYIFIKYQKSDKQYLMKKHRCEILNSSDTNSKDVYTYFKQIAEERVSNATYENKRSISENIVRQLGKLVPYNKNALHAYISKEVHPQREREHLIFPFGINETQLEAVNNAFASQVSIIEGPPGTGKTQTILNIIANIVINNETCAIVSNNNTAVMNVYEKLEKVDLSFFVAKLGKTENKDEFFYNLN